MSNVLPNIYISSMKAIKLCGHEYDLKFRKLLLIQLISEICIETSSDLFLFVKRIKKEQKKIL